MQTKHYIIMIAVIVALAFTIGLLTCNSKKKPTEIVLHPTKNEVDSANIKKAKEKAFKDSLVTVITRLDKHNDSLESVVKKQSDVLNVKTLKINALTKEAALYRKYNDIPNYIEACDSLLPQISDLTSTLDIYRKDNAVLMDSISRMEDEQSLLTARMEFYQTDLQASLERVSNNALQLESNNKKLEKKSKKRWVITAQASYIFDGQQWRYGAGVGFGRVLARF
jgi:chromosome segregation ATPase